MSKKKVKSLQFTCPECGEHVLECCMDGPHSCVVNEVMSDGSIDWGSYTSEGELCYYGRNACGCQIASSDESLVKWLKEHSK